MNNPKILKATNYLIPIFFNVLSALRIDTFLYILFGNIYQDFKNNVCIEEGHKNRLKRTLDWLFWTTGNSGAQGKFRNSYFISSVFNFV